MTFGRLRISARIRKATGFATVKKFTRETVHRFFFEKMLFWFRYPSQIEASRFKKRSVLPPSMGHSKKSSSRKTVKTIVVEVGCPHSKSDGCLKKECHSSRSAIAEYAFLSPGYWIWASSNEIQ
jgi:hypothetical protein